MTNNNNIALNNKLSRIHEGSVEFLIYLKDKNTTPSKSMKVFYNKDMEINRDITILAVKAYSELYNNSPLIIVDTMAASGIGSIRLIKECQFIKTAYINDINPIAVKLIERNLKLNALSKQVIELKITHKDANLLLTEIAQKSCNISNNVIKKPSIVMIDPFGTPNLYLDSAFKAIQKKRGLICVTATDTAVLFGTHPKTCKRKYMSKPLHTEYCKEIGARILIYFISRIANINDLGIIPLLTFYSKHFIRLFALTFKNKNQIDKCLKTYGYVFHCYNCGFRKTFSNKILELPKKCPLCGEDQRLDFAGPLWLDRIHKEIYIKKLLTINNNSGFKNEKRIEKLLNFMLKEIDMPCYYYNTHKLCQNLKLSSVPKNEELIQLIEERGYRASRTIFDFSSIKSDIDIYNLKKILLELQNH